MRAMTSGAMSKWNICTAGAVDFCLAVTNDRGFPLRHNHPGCAGLRKNERTR